MVNDNLILYTIDCPRCKILEDKLCSAKILYSVCYDKDTMKSKGYTQLPMLEVNGKPLTYFEAVKYINNNK